jgi:hypothetical protein
MCPTTEAIEMEREFVSVAVPASLLNLSSKLVNLTIDKKGVLLKEQVRRAGVLTFSFFIIFFVNSF